MEKTKAFKYHNDYKMPFDGLFGDTPELRIIHTWIGLDPPGDDYFFLTKEEILDISEYSHENKIYKKDKLDELTKILDKMVYYKLIEKRGNKYSPYFQSNYWKGINIFNLDLIDSVVNIIREHEKYTKEHIELKEDGTYKLECPICARFMEDVSWRVLPKGKLIIMECNLCKFSCQCHTDDKHPPSKSKIPLSFRLDMLSSCPEWIKKYEEENDVSTV